MGVNLFSYITLGFAAAFAFGLGCEQGLDLGSSGPTDDAGADSGGQTTNILSDAGHLAGPDLGGDAAISDAGMPAPLEGVTSISGGWHHACAVARGELYCWGSNDYGQLGLGDGEDRFVATRVGEAVDWDEVECGYFHTCATKTDGTIWCWGRNEVGQLADRTLVNRAMPQLVEMNNTPVLNFDSDANHLCLVDSTNGLQCWGDNREGQIGQGNVGSEYERPVAVTADNGAGWLTVATGEGHTCAIRSDGVAMCWGRNTRGMAGGTVDQEVVRSPAEVGGPAPPTKSWIEVEAGSTTTLLRAEDNLWYGMGSANGSRLPGLSMDSFDPVALAVPSSLETIDSSTFQSCGLDAAGVVKCWGVNLDGMLLDTDIGGALMPFEAAPDLGVVERVAAGRFVTCVIDSGGALYCRGENGRGGVGGGVPPGDVPKWTRVVH